MGTDGVSMIAGDEVSTSTALVVIPAAELPTIIAADKDDILSKLAAKVAAHRGDASTPAGRQAIRSLAHEVATSKMDLVRLAGSLTEEWRHKTKAVNAERKMIEERMDALKEQVRAPLTEYEQRDERRVAAHEAVLAAIPESPDWGERETSSEIRARLDRLRGLLQDPGRDWQEFAGRFTATVAAEIERAERALQVVLDREESAESARVAAHEQAIEAIVASAKVPTGASAETIRAIVRAFDAEPERIWEEYAATAAERIGFARDILYTTLAAAEAREAEERAAREAQIAAEAAEAARVAAEARAAEEAAAAAREAADREEALRRQAAEAEAAAQRAEADRIAGHRRAIWSLSNDNRSPTEGVWTVREVDEAIARLSALYNRDWQEFGVEAGVAHEQAHERLMGQRKRAVQREADEAADARAAQEAETARREAAAAEEARAAEQARVLREVKAAADAAAKREADRAHRGRINREARDAIEKVMESVAGSSNDEPTHTARAIVEAIARLQVPHIRISY